MIINGNEVDSKAVIAGALTDTANIPGERGEDRHEEGYPQQHAVQGEIRCYTTRTMSNETHHSDQRRIKCRVQQRMEKIRTARC